MPQRLIGHNRPKVGATNADVHNVSNASPRVALPCTAPHLVSKVRHLIEHSVYQGNHVFAIDDDGRRARGAEGHVQYSAIFGDIDSVTSKHRVDSRTQATLLGKSHQEFESLVGDAILRVIEEHTGCLDRQAFATFWIIAEELPQMDILDFLLVSLQVMPHRGFC